MIKYAAIALLASCSPALAEPECIPETSFNFLVDEAKAYLVFTGYMGQGRIEIWTLPNGEWVMVGFAKDQACRIASGLNPSA